MDPKAEKQRFVDNTFTKCEGTYYLGLLDLPKLACSDVFREGPPRLPKDCRAVIEFKDMQFNVDDTRTQPLSVADGLNGIRWRGFLTANYPAFRVRHIADGVGTRGDSGRTRRSREGHI
jgi:hypothetical protein